MDPIMELGTTLVEAVAENPFAVAFLASIARNVTGYLWKKTKYKVKYDKREFLATLVKFEVAVPAFTVLAGLVLAPSQATIVASASVVLADVVASWRAKLQ